MPFTDQQIGRVTQLRQAYADKFGEECDMGIDQVVAILDKNQKATDDKLIQLMHDNAPATAGNEQGTKTTE